MSSSTTIITLGIAIAAITIALIAVTMSITTTSQATNQNTLQTSNIQHYTGEKREFWLSDSEIPGFNETQMGMPKDIYSMPVMAVFKGDKMVIHFFNIEQPGGDNHSFTIFDKPYNINVVVHPGENTTMTLDANTTGVFTYYCTFHYPTMRGQLIVQPPPY
ncbi:MAG: cupredoxin domain-containing protein [Thaumarchaeota archaeon]|nr:cupredoxin domain-containing protein [Nitrososphaerota archaeon]